MTKIYIALYDYEDCFGSGASLDAAYEDLRNRVTSDCSVQECSFFEAIRLDVEMKLQPKIMEKQTNTSSKE